MPVRSSGIARITLCTLAFGIAASSLGANAPRPASGRDAPAAGARSLPRADIVIGVVMDSLEIASDPEGKPSPGAAHQAGRVIPDTPLSLPRIKGADILADLQIGALRVRRDVSMRAVSARISLGESRLRVDPVAFAGARGGTFSGTLEVSALADKRYRIAARIETTGLDADTVIGLLGAHPVASGAKTDAKLALGAEGATLRNLAATLNGDVLIVVGPGRFPHGALDFGGDTLVRVFDTVNPFSKREKETRLECAALRFPIRDGVAVIENGLGFETDRVSVIATGAVNLRDESLDLAFHPQLREGLGVSLQTTLAEMVRVQGTLTHPVIGMDVAGSARTALNIGAAVLTGGGTLVASTLFDRAVAARACDAALGKVQPSRPSATGMITETAKTPIRILDRMFRK